jgi:hypothetical protein
MIAPLPGILRTFDTSHAFGMFRVAVLTVLAGPLTPLALAADITGSGRSVTERRDVAAFHGIALSAPAHVDVARGGAEAVSITADDNVLGEIETVVENGVLQVRVRPTVSLRTRNPIRVAVTARQLDSIAIAGAGDVNAPALAAPRLAVRLAGSGGARLGGKADELDASLSGSGGLDAARLESRRAQVALSGSGQATVWAREALRVRIAGSGGVRYYGDPVVERSIAGSGSLRRAGAAPS